MKKAHKDNLFNHIPLKEDYGDRIHCGAQVRTVKAFCLDISYFLMAWLLSVRDLMTRCYEKSDMVVLSQTHNEVCFVGISVQQRS